VLCDWKEGMNLKVSSREESSVLPDTKHGGVVVNEGFSSNRRVVT
jgi:hypothetical protein